MSGMKINLEGYFRNVVHALPRDARDYHAFCLEEVLGHLKDVVAGRHTVAEFAEHYCLQIPAQKEETKEDIKIDGKGMVTAITDYWLKYYADQHCTLCGNVGIIDSRGVRTPAGFPVGRLNWCICPNGQALRQQSGLVLPPESMVPR